MKGQSQINQESKKRREEVYRYMVLCIRFGLEFSYIRNFENEAMSIKLKPGEYLHLSFSKWGSSLERATLYDHDIQLPVNLRDAYDMIRRDGVRFATVISKQINTWLKILWMQKISFEFKPRDLIVKASKDTRDHNFKFVIRFSKQGDVIAANCRLNGENYHFVFADSLEFTFYRFLDLADEKTESSEDLVS